MRTEALPSLTLGRFERRLRIGLGLAFIGIAVLLVGLGIWADRPFHAVPLESQHVGELAPASSQTALSTEVAR